MVLDVYLELNQPPTLHLATPSDLGPRTSHGTGGIAERAWPPPQDYELKLFPLLVLLGSDTSTHGSGGSGWEGGTGRGSFLAPNLSTLPLLSFCCHIPCGLFSCPGFLSSPCGFSLSSPMLNVAVVSSPETEPIPRSKKQIGMLSLSPDVGGHTDAEPFGHLSCREWHYRVIPLTLRAKPVEAGSSFSYPASPASLPRDPSSPSA